MVTRRGFLTGMLALGVAPAIVRAASLMPVTRTLWVPDQSLLTGEIRRFEGFGYFNGDIVGGYEPTFQHPNNWAMHRRLVTREELAEMYALDAQSLAYRAMLDKAGIRHG